MNIRAITSTLVGRAGLAIVERALLGVVTFIVTMLLGRWGGPAELALFVKFYPLVFIAIAFQESLVIVPYMVYWTNHAEGDERRRYLGSVLWHSLLLSAAIAGGLSIGAAAFVAAGFEQFALATLLLALACPCVLLREFARRVVYAERKTDVAVAISGGVGACQLGVMGALCLFAGGRLTATVAFVALAVSSVIGGGAWLALNRRQIQMRGAAIKESFRQNWTLGGWSLGTQISEIVALYMYPWLLALVVDERTVGVYAACAVLGAILLPLHIALSNVLVPEMVHVQQQSGSQATRRLTRQATLALGGIMVAFCAVVAMLSGHLVPWVYGDKFAGVAGTAATLVVVALSQLAAGAALPAARALLVFNRPQAIFYSQLAGIVVSIALGMPMIVQWGIVGAAYASLAGAVARAALVAWNYQQAVAGAPVESRREPYRAVPSSDVLAEGAS